MDLAGDEFHPTCLRFSTIYGLSGRTRFDLVINLLTAKALIDKKITIQGGDQWRPFLHVDDAALSVLTALEAPLHAVHMQVYNVGSDEQNCTIRGIGELINEKVTDAAIVDVGAGGDRRNYKANFAKIRENLGFMPRWTIEDGIEQVIDIIRSGEVSDYTSAKYSNVKFLTEENASRFVRHDSDWAYDLISATSNLGRIVKTAEAVAA